VKPGPGGSYAPEGDFALLEHVARTIGDFVLVTDIEGKLTWVNEAVLARSGWTRDELLGKPWRLFLGDVNPPGLAEKITAATRAGGFQGDILNVTKQGEVLWVALRTSILLRGGAVDGFVSISTDISGRKRVEEELTAARDAAEAASRAKTEFLANISHEIRTPMNAVIGMAGLLLETSLTPEQQDYVETIRTSGDTLLTLLNDVLDFSKMESERLELESRPFSLRDAVEDSFDLVAPAAAAKGVDLSFRIEPSVPATLEGDVTRVRQILLNLLSNAVKFTPSGEIVLRASSKQTGDQKREIEILVRDTGIGIPRKRLDLLFQSFSQVDPSTTRRFGGTGLGLAICKGLAERMGGGISVSSDPSLGSTFRVTFVAAVGPPPTISEAIPGVGRLVGQRVLLVDDAPGSREALSETLSSWGMVVRATASPQEALSWIEAGEPFDVGLLDEEMPGLDGRRLAEAIRLSRDADELPLLLVTSRGRRAGGTRGTFVAALARPVRPRSLASALAGLRDDSVSRRRRRSAAPTLPSDLARTHPLQILLAEDNVVNQKVALSYLSRMGYAADVATTGREALEAVRRESYDVVLMDVQMPEMDGFEATRRIRALGPGEKGPWIVAVTASAMTGDPEKCLAAGMNDYLSKPVRVDDLAAALRRAPRRTRRSPPANALPVLVPGPLRALKGLERPGEEGFLASLLEIFRRDTPLRVEEMERSATSADAESFRRAAHSLKSSASSLGGARVEALCARMEKLSAEPGGLDEAARLLPSLKDETAVLLEVLAGDEGPAQR